MYVLQGPLFDQMPFPCGQEVLQGNFLRIYLCMHTYTYTPCCLSECLRACLHGCLHGGKTPVCMPGCACLSVFCLMPLCMSISVLLSISLCLFISLCLRRSLRLCCSRLSRCQSLWFSLGVCLAGISPNYYTQPYLSICSCAYCTECYDIRY